MTKPPRRMWSTMASLLALALAGGLAAQTNPIGFMVSIQTVSRQDESKGGRAVSVDVGKSTYGRDEPIAVVVRNNSTQQIHIPGDPSACSLLTVQQWQNGSWEIVGSCPPATAPGLTVIVPEAGRVVGTLNSGPVSYVVEVLASDPASPAVFEGSLEQLPPAGSWRPGDPVMEMPLGVLDPEREALPLSTVEAQLNYGTYRVMVTYSLSMPHQSVQTSYSGIFIVAKD
jgi:hypothetical protein